MNDATKPEQESRWRRLWLDWRGFFAFVAIMLVFRSAIADWNQVPSGSMIPSILEGDRIVVDKMAYDLRVPFTFVRITRRSDPQRSDIITFESPKDGKLLVKRVVGVPGDIVELRDNRLHINGVAATYSEMDRTLVPDPVIPILPYVEVATESLLQESRSVMVRRRRHPDIPDTFGPTRVPEGHYLVLGDNRDNSQDFRFIGFVPRDSILGKANSVAFSLDYENYYLPRSNRFFHDLE